MADLRTTPDRPRRRSYETGDTLPAVETVYRPMNLGLDSVGNNDSQIRAFAVGILNRSDSSIYVKESEESDEIEVPRFESYDIWEPNGVSSVMIRGENGGEKVVIRTLEGHNDFDIGDKIDAFVRSISHFLTSSKQETVITDAETVIPINGDVGITNDVLTVDGDVTADIAGGVTVDNDVLDVQGNVSADVTGDVGITNDVLNVEGNVDINTNADTADITTELIGSTVRQDIDITKASLGDLRVADRTAKTTVVTFRFKNQAVDSDGNPQTLTAYLFTSAPFDGYVQNYTVRHYADPAEFSATGDGFPGLDLIGFAPELDEGSGYAPAVNRDYLSGRQIKNFSRDSNEVEMLRYDSGHEIIYRIEPNQKIEFQETDGLRFLLGVYAMNDDFDGETTYVPTGLQTTDRWITEVTLTVGEIERN